MTEAELKALCESTLNVPCYEAGDAATYPCTTYEVISDNTALHGDGAGKVREYDIQLDLWFPTRGGRDTAKGQMLTALASYKITTPDITLSYEQKANVWRATFHFTTL